MCVNNRRILRTLRLLGVLFVVVCAGENSARTADTREETAVFEKGNNAETPIETAKTQAYAGLVAEAKLTAAKIGDADQQSTAYRWIATAQAEAGAIKEAKTTLRHITNPQIRAITLCSIAKAQADAGDFAGAKITAAGISRQVPSSLAYRLIALTQVKAGNISDARKTLKQVSREEDRAIVRKAIAKADPAAADATNAIKTAQAKSTKKRPAPGTGAKPHLTAAEDGIDSREAAPRAAAEREVAKNDSRAVATVEAKPEPIATLDGPSVGNTLPQANVKPDVQQIETAAKILVLFVSPLLGIVAIVLFVTTLWRRSSQALAALAIFLTAPVALAFFSPSPIFASLLDSVLSGTGCVGTSFFGLLLFLFVVAAFAFFLASYVLRYATGFWLKGKCGLVASLCWSLLLLLAAVAVFQTIVFTALILTQAICG